MMYINNISINVKQSNRSRVRCTTEQIRGTTRGAQQNNRTDPWYDARRTTEQIRGTMRAMGEKINREHDPTSSLRGLGVSPMARVVPRIYSVVHRASYHGSVLLYAVLSTY